MIGACLKRPGPLGWPWWVWSIAAGLAATQPMLLIWIAYFPPAGTAPTGMHIPDSALFLYSMRMFDTDFESVYATCKSPYGTRYAGYYPLTYLWMYGGLGVVADWLGVDHFLFYGLCTGLGAFLYLAVVYAFLRQVMPNHAGLAFLLFTLSGGVGGVAYMATGALGLHDSPVFDALFLRYAMYELVEGPHLPPVTCLPRLYYTLSLALCLGGLTALIRRLHGGGAATLAWAVALLFGGAIVNARYGVFVWAIAVIYLWSQPAYALRERVRLAALFALPALAAAVVNRALLRTNPVVVDNVLEIANMAMWFSPFVTATALHFLLAPRAIAVRLPRLSPLQRMCAWGAIGYLAAFAALFCLNRVYYGEIITCREGSVAAAISDWALIGAVVGIGYAFARRRPHAESDEHAWVVLWLLAFLSFSISGFGRGWFLRFGPQRLQVFLWLPIGMLSALGLRQCQAKRPRFAAAIMATLLVCGVSSALVGLLCFQGPLGRMEGRGPYSNLHAEVMSLADARLIESMGRGRVLALPPASDAVVLRRGNPVVYGVGSFNLTDQPCALLRNDAQRFFSTDASEDERRSVVREWRVDYVYCPDTWPVAPEVVDELRNASWLEETVSARRGVVFRVRE